MDDERLKNPPVAGSVVSDHFADLLARIRDIRANMPPPAMCRMGWRTSSN